MVSTKIRLYNDGYLFEYYTICSKVMDIYDDTYRVFKVLQNPIKQIFPITLEQRTLI